MTNPFELLYEQMTKLQQQMAEEMHALREEIKELRNAHDDDTLLTSKELGERLGYDTRTIYRWNEDGKISYVEGTTRYRLSEVLEQLKQTKLTTLAKAS